MGRRRPPNAIEIANSKVNVDFIEEYLQPKYVLHKSIFRGSRASLPLHYPPHAFLPHSQFLTIQAQHGATSGYIPRRGIHSLSSFVNPMSSAQETSRRVLILSRKPLESTTSLRRGDGIPVVRGER